MSGSQVFYMGDNGEVLTWDGITNIETANYCVTRDGGAPVFSTTAPDEPDGTNCPSGRIGPPGHTGAYGPTGATDSAAAAVQASWYRGYEQAKADYRTFYLPSGQGVHVDDPSLLCSVADPVGPIDYDIGYAQALRDVLIEITSSGKQNLVQWLEARLKDLP